MANKINTILCMLTLSLGICICGFIEAYKDCQLFMPVDVLEFASLKMRR